MLTLAAADAHVLLRPRLPDSRLTGLMTHHSRFQISKFTGLMDSRFPDLHTLRFPDSRFSDWQPFRFPDSRFACRKISRFAGPQVSRFQISRFARPKCLDIPDWQPSGFQIPDFQICTPQVSTLSFQIPDFWKSGIWKPEGLQIWKSGIWKLRARKSGNLESLET